MLDIKVELEKLRTMYTADIAQHTHNMLLLGSVGSGKTSMLATAIKPVLIHSFDPGGTKLHGFKPLVESGEMIVDTRFEKETGLSKLGGIPNPVAYRLWESVFEEYRKDKLFNSIGTYCIDSFTTFIDSLKNEIAKRRGRKDGVLEIQDWQVVGNVIRDVIKLCTALPCNFILTGHLSVEKEEVSGKMIARFYSIPSLQVNVPLLFDEIYVLEAVETSKGIERSVITAPTGKVEARTRIGSGVFETREKPDIKYLLAKAGLPTEDKKTE